MPRVANEGTAVSEWNQRTGEGSSTWDVCLGCYWDVVGRPTRETGLLTYKSGETQGRIEGGVEHPPYQDEECSGYRCEVCYKKLTKRDNGGG